jgi:phosphatidylinositol N-acetylglucosaminyltransferase subunit A
VDLLVGLLPSICASFPTVDFIIGGDGAKMLNLQEMIERERLQERVQLLGSVPHAQVRNVLVRGHIFLNCSLTESFCIAILEAASCGLLVVSTNVGGIPEVLPEDMIMLADPNVASMVRKVRDAVERLVRHDAIDPWKTHERIKAMYSWKLVATETINVYDSVLRQRRRSFCERMACYKSPGGISGFVACFAALIVHLWLLFVELWQPRHMIDIVPDLVAPERWGVYDDCLSHSFDGTAKASY